MAKEKDKSTLRKPGEYLPEEDPSLLTAKIAASWRNSDSEEKKILEEWWTSWSVLLARFLLWLSKGR
jgi:hypothetical protein